MKKVIIGLGSALVLSTSVNAQTIQDHYKTVTKKIPNTERVCEQKTVPVYGTITHDQPNSGESIIIGSILGGILGNNIKGENNGGAAGAVIGGLLGNAHANKKRQSHDVVGYQNVNQCRNITTYTTETKDVYSHSTITFIDDDGVTRTATFRK